MIKVIELKAEKHKLYTMIYETPKEKKTQTLHVDTVLKYNLLNAKTLDEKTFKTLLEDDIYTQTFMHAIGLLAKKPYARQGLLKAIKRKENNHLLQKVLDELESLNYINEEKTVDYLVNEMMTFDLVGPQHIEKKLLQEGYKEPLIKQALSQYNETIEEEKCQAFMEKQVKQSKAEPLDKMLYKLKTKAYQKGFSLSIIDDTLETMKATLQENTDEEALLKQTIERLKKRYDLNDPKEKNKMMQKLMRDGFHYSMIKNMME